VYCSLACGLEKNAGTPIYFILFSIRQVLRNVLALNSAKERSNYIT